MLPPVTRNVHSPHASLSKPSGSARQISRSRSIAGFESSYMRGCAIGSSLTSFLVGRNPPSISGSILHATDAIAPRHIRWLSNRFGAEAHRAFAGLIDVGNVEIDRSRHRGIGKIAVSKEQMRVADFSLGVEFPLSIRRGIVRHLGAESILDEIYEVELRIQIGRDGREAGLNMFVGVVHGVDLLDVITRDSEHGAKSSVNSPRRGASWREILPARDGRDGRARSGLAQSALRRISRDDSRCDLRRRCW